MLGPARIPCSSDEDASFICYYVGGYLRRVERAGDVVLSAEEQEALVESPGRRESSQYYLDMQFADGGIQLLTNRGLLHG